MDDALDRQYLTWLYAQVESVKQRNPQKTYWSLMRQMFSKQYVWLVPNDDNRAKDGQELRQLFLQSVLVGHVDLHWLNMQCSMLEMLIGLSRRLSFEGGGELRDWFWHLVETLQIRCNDAAYNGNTSALIDEVLDRVIWRTYHPNGRGGLFPLQHPMQDQTRVEIWHQLNSYLLELG